MTGPAPAPHKPRHMPVHRHIRQRAPSRGWLPALLLALTTCTAPAGQTIRHDDVADARATPRSVRVVRVAVRTGDIGLSASGTLVSAQIHAATSDIPGIVVDRVLAQEGAFVTAGQVLAVLDDTLIRSQIAQQAAVIAQQRVAVRQTGAEAARGAPMLGAGVLSGEAVQARRFRADSAIAALHVQEAQMRELQARAARLLIRAPVGGRVMERNVRVGDLSGAPQPMFTIVPGGTIELQVQVPESRLTQLRIGMTAAVTLADGSALVGRVTLIGTRIDRQTAQGNVRLHLSPVAGAPPVELRPGASGTAHFEGTGAPASAVPEAAVQYDTGGASVMALGKDDRVHRMPVRTGQRGGGYVTLVDGPAPGTTVLAAAASFVAEGDRVTPIVDAP